MHQAYGGISRYFCELARQMGTLRGVSSTVVAPMHINEYLTASPARVLGTRARWRPKKDRHLNALNWRASAGIYRLRPPDLVHRTYYGQGVRTWRSPSVVTVFDMIHELYPSSFPPSDPTSADKRRAVAMADQVICISHSTKRDLVELFDCDPAKVHAIHLGFNADFAAAAGERRPAESARPYFLYVGGRSGYKNFSTFVRAYAASNRLRKECRLLAFGGGALNHEERALMQELGLQDGDVAQQSGSDHELVQQYRHAIALVYPSLYEGFGIPPLEAMSAGCPVICSNASSLPEVVGDAAVTIDPQSTEALREAMEKLLGSDVERAGLIKAGRQQVTKFSWARCATETLQVYQRACGR